MTRRDEWSFFWVGVLIGAALAVIACGFVVNRAATALSDKAQQTIENYKHRAEACEEK